MKGMYGLDVLAKLRELDPLARVIVLSADIQTSSRQMVMEAGAAAFLNKPVVPEELLAAVAGALGGEA
jgi:two-component system chemotaxis response regulator CheY